MGQLFFLPLPLSHVCLSSPQKKPSLNPLHKLEAHFQIPSSHKPSFPLITSPSLTLYARHVRTESYLSLNTRRTHKKPSFPPSSPTTGGGHRFNFSGASLNATIIGDYGQAPPPPPVANNNSNSHGLPLSSPCSLHLFLSHSSTTASSPDPANTAAPSALGYHSATSVELNQASSIIFPPCRCRSHQLH